MSRRVAVVAKLAHNQMVGGSNPPAATISPLYYAGDMMNREELIDLILDEEDEKDEKDALKRMKRFKASVSKKQRSNYGFGKKKLKEINRRSK